MGMVCLPYLARKCKCLPRLYTGELLCSCPSLGKLWTSHELVEFLNLSHLISLNLVSQPGWHKGSSSLGPWELLSAAPWMMLLALLIAPIPPSQPEITSMGEADKETGLYMPFLSLLICLSLVGSCRIMESRREEKSYHWIRKYGAPGCGTVWGSLIQGLEVSSVYRQNKTFAQKRPRRRAKTH